MEPLPETVEAANELDPSDDDDLLEQLLSASHQVRELVPDLVGVSVAALERELTFTVVASTLEIALLDAVQYLSGGPCVEGAKADVSVELDHEDLFDEEDWREFAEATAAYAVRSTLTLPVVSDGRVTGSVNLYAASRRAFVGLHERIAEHFGAWAPGAVSNADLAFTTRLDAAKAPERARQHTRVESAIGVLAAELGLDIETATDRLHDAAARANVSDLEFAEALLEIRQRRSHDLGS